jgi:TonB family protein
MSRRFVAALCVPLAIACGGSDQPSDGQGAQAAPPPESEAPVALNPDIPIGYPPALFEQRIEGDVILRLYADSGGRLIPESTRVAESSGIPALDSAALTGSAGLRFAPAKRHGIPVATAFLQPVEFRQATNATGTTPPPAPRPAPPPPPAAPRPRAPVVRARPDTAPRDSVRADTMRPPPPAPPPQPPPQPPPPPPPPADTSGPAH